MNVTKDEPGSPQKQGAGDVESVSPRLSEALMRDPRLTAKFYPYAAREDSYLVGKQKDPRGPGLPIPPREFWYGYADTNDGYLSWGHEVVGNLKDILSANGFELRPGHRVLDFGCASGIMLRWLPDVALANEVWGVDINGPVINWCQLHLSPPFRFATTTTLPHLPFEDNFFDLIYAGSVFTHIADLAEMWLLELRRILRPGGRLYITIHDEHTIELIERNPEANSFLDDLLKEFSAHTPFSSSDFSMLAINRTPGPGARGQAQVFYHTDFIRRHWGSFLKVIAIHSEAYGSHSAVVLEKS
jgi:ubiquinone/menaquinone biosynthesis C-methylase UbiE